MSGNQFDSTRAMAGLFLLAVGTVDLYLCPYSKVEESFNLQATHDLYYFGLGIMDDFNPQKYDHLSYPGVVPRTFAGPCMLSSALKLFPISNLDAANVSLLARWFLLLLVMSQFYSMAGAIDTFTRNRHTGTYFLLVTACQFHLPFYASRMLPNTFALILTLRSCMHWLRGNERLEAVVDMVLATVVFRCDVLLLLAPVGLSWLLTRQVTIVEAVGVGLATSAVGLLLTVPLDSHLWQRRAWPEGEVFYFNTVLNKSGDWGTSPWYWYWTSALPKLLLFTLLLVPLSIVRVPSLFAVDPRRSSTSPINHRSFDFLDRTWLPFVLPAVAFVFLYSFLGHKEVRFLFPVMPLFNLSAAAGLGRLHLGALPPKGKTPCMTSRLLFAFAIHLLLFSFGASCVYVQVSRWNYPGGAALQHLQAHVAVVASKADSDFDSPALAVNVHIDVAAAMTGVSLFGQRSAELSSPNVSWTFQKAGYELQHELSNGDSLSSFTHILTERQDISDEFRVVGVAQGNPWIDFRRATIATTDSIYILERKDWVQDEA